MSKEEAIAWLKTEKESAKKAQETLITDEQKERLTHLEKALTLAIKRIRDRKTLGDIEQTLSDCHAKTA